MQPLFHLLFDIAAMAMALHVTPADARALLTDPRTATPILKRRIAAETNGWRLEPGRGGVDQLRDTDSQRWTVKTISAVVDFRPSAQIGKGRSTDPAGVAGYWGGIAGYLLVDMSKLPDVAVYRVPIATVAAWWKDPHASNYRINHAQLMQRLEAAP